MQDTLTCLPAYLLAVATLVLAALGCVLRRSTLWAGILLCIFALSRAQVSHAAGSGLFGAAMLIDALHLLLGAVWAGSVFVAAWVVMPACGKAPPLHYMQRLSRAAALALAGIVASGLFGAWQRLDAPQRLLDHPYGAVLSIKLALFAGTALLGACNRFIGFPRASSDGGAMALRVLRVESGLLLGALAAASLLTLQPAPH
ncbi:copper resistance D family protein [Massilia sp. TWP1-3-3]|uniref:copper resistance D family protein n=1 Tax=Massilia sp. TWP1-3-3 TaxID=2804573 RepID=UPI003CED8AF7